MASTTAEKPRPFVPLEDWQRVDKVNLEVVGYGWHGKCVRVRMHLPMDRNVQRLHNATRELMRDVKHSANWRCQFCGRFSRETQVQTYTWVSIDPAPRMGMYMHHICDHERKKCFKEMEEIHNYMQTVDGLPVTPLPRPPKKPRNELYPRAGSCAGCQKDGSLFVDQQRCSKCNLTRYCSLKCQADDLPRHQPTCKQIFSVQFERREPLGDTEEPGTDIVRI
ncbi:hypothetical protein PYCCODRAFT_1432803 [Trametes coccinea BRFM310]|uniref:MYND-type domain-containing protein n=1 Tax=Trametes coccinea (strain BRFM310) TaxID=1353009 RepID=A0A1Y2IV79_TRAC3|nr:hypothetical protein PYCCODRAFT_1432803 [Trametes coccinea BRFM310]